MPVYNYLDPQGEGLKLELYILRHGESRANQEKIIISDPEIGTVDFGLTDMGRDQIQLLAGSEPKLDTVSVIVSSDFLRARETAEIIALRLGLPVIMDKRLRERFFGSLEGMDDTNYYRAWEADREGRSDFGVEPVKTVAERMLAAVEEYGTRFPRERVLFVSHGDPLQILMTALAGSDPAFHRNQPPLEKGELQEIKMQSDS